MKKDTQDPESLAKAYKKKNEREEARRQTIIAEKSKAAREEVDRLVECFREIDPGLKRLILFGSLAEKRVRREDSDIDLAFDGTKYIQCLSIALQSSFKVDLLDIKTARPGIRKEIEQYGEIVFYDQ
jgi:predicted nucleotidyltransferase